jgi:hypothetical protein
MTKSYVEETNLFLHCLPSNSDLKNNHQQPTLVYYIDKIVV